MTEESELGVLRGRSFAIAYRMLGSVADAEDIVQEALLRVHRAQESGEQIETPLAFIATITTRLSITQLTSARARRERYVGEWLPEPIIIDDARDDPAQTVELADSLSLALLVLLERLSPEQRAVLLLHDVFDYDYAEIAEMLGTSRVNARQLGTRARQHVRANRPRYTPTLQQRKELTQRFLVAARSGDLGSLQALLAADVTFTGDGGGRVPALAAPLRGRVSVGQTLIAWFQSGPPSMPGVEVRLAAVNAGSGAVFLDAQQRLLGVWAFDLADGRIARIDSVVNPDKLAHLGPLGDFAGLIGPAKS